MCQALTSIPSLMHLSPGLQVGGLMLGGLHYGKIGANRFVRLSHLALRNNTPCTAGRYLEGGFSQVSKWRKLLHNITQDCWHMVTLSRCMRKEEAA